MIRIASVMALTAIVTTAVFAQGNVPQAQSICAMGHAKASKGDMMDKISPAAMKRADKDSDGKLSKSEFDAACANRLFKEMEKGT